MGLCGSHPARLGGQRRPCAPPRAPRSPGGRESPRPAPAPAPGGPMLLLGLLLLTSALAGRRPGTRAEPSLSLGGKFQLPGAKEQNGECALPPRRASVSSRPGPGLGPGPGPGAAARPGLARRREARVPAGAEAAPGRGRRPEEAPP